jgi:hypothetical protein
MKDITFDTFSAISFFAPEYVVICIASHYVVCPCGKHQVLMVGVLATLAFCCQAFVKKISECVFSHPVDTIPPLHHDKIPSEGTRA